MKPSACLSLFGLLLVCLLSCKKQAPVPKSASNGTTGTTGVTGTTDTTKTLKTDFYYVGYINPDQSPGKSYAELWKNGVVTPLSNAVSSASHIWVSKGNTYVCGSELFNKTTCAVYWKNFTPTVMLTDGSEYGSIANDIAVQDSDILIVGNVSDKTGHKAILWRNRQATVLTTNGSATRILIKGNDIYITGTSNGYACYWKNGVVHNLTTGAQATGIAIDDNSNIYVCGTQNNSPVYWKNDVMIALPHTTKITPANAIATKGSDVYVVGSGQGSDPYFGYVQAYCWKNGVSQDFPGGSEADDIAIVGDHLYIAGAHAAALNRYGRIWDGTSITYLDPDGPISVFNGMYIDQHY